MITRDAEQFIAALQGLPADQPGVPQGIFMVMPEAFRVDPESATDNVYMDLHSATDPACARTQAEALAALVESLGVPVTRFPGDPATPDAVFPNNVFATAPGRFIVGSMRHPGRRCEAGRADIRARLQAGRTVYDLSQRDCIAELTGVLIIDRARRVGWCGMSPRVDEAGLEALHEAFGLRLTHAFELAAGEYHTNVVMSVLASRACIAHANSFVDPGVVATLQAAFPGRVLLLDDLEKANFAANCLAVTDTDLLFSARALGALCEASQALLRSWGFQLHAVELDEIEKAGGSLRCMLGEIF